MRYLLCLSIVNHHQQAKHALQKCLLTQPSQPQTISSYQYYCFKCSQHHRRLKCCIHWGWIPAVCDIVWNTRVRIIQFGNLVWFTVWMWNLCLCNNASLAYTEMTPVVDVGFVFVKLCVAGIYWDHAGIIFAHTQPIWVQWDNATRQMQQQTMPRHRTSIRQFDTSTSTCARSVRYVKFVTEKYRVRPCQRELGHSFIITNNCRLPPCATQNIHETIASRDCTFQIIPLVTADTHSNCTPQKMKLSLKSYKSATYHQCACWRICSLSGIGHYWSRNNSRCVQYSALQ